MNSRNFHIFYFLVKGADPALRKELNLVDDVTQFDMIKGLPVIKTKVRGSFFVPACLPVLSVFSSRTRTCAPLMTVRPCHRVCRIHVCRYSSHIMIATNLRRW